MSRMMRMDRAHDVNISFWPASGSSGGALAVGVRQWSEEACGLTVGVCVDCVSLYTGQMVSDMFLIGRTCSAHTEQLVEGPPPHGRSHGGIRETAMSWAACSARRGRMRARCKCKVAARGPVQPRLRLSRARARAARATLHGEA